MNLLFLIVFVLITYYKREKIITGVSLKLLIMHSYIS